MDVSSIWWTQVGSSVRLLERIVERLRGERSFTLVLPQPLAWPDTFYSLVKDHACSISAERTLHYAVYARVWMPLIHTKQLLNSTFSPAGIPRALLARRQLCGISLPGREAAVQQLLCVDQRHPDPRCTAGLADLRGGL